MQKVNVVMRQHNVWCVCVCVVHVCILCGEVCWTLDLSTQNARTHTKCYAAASPH